MTKDVLVTGCRGQLGSDLMLGLADQFAVAGFDIDEVDICSAPRVEEYIRFVSPQVVIHAAAFTDVDGCESNPELAMAVNSAGAENVARVCGMIGAKMIYYSTDYIFDGRKRSQYTEDDIPGPKTIYGRSKWEGERAVSRTLENNAILRIAWVYGRFGRNFVKTMIGLGKRQQSMLQHGKEASPLKVVADQIGNPTWTEDICRQTAVVIENDLTGVFHCTSENETSWYNFAKEIFEELHMDVHLVPCSTEEIPRLASRPPFSSLANARLKELGLNLMPDYRQSLKSFLNKYGARLLHEIND